MAGICGAIAALTSLLGTGLSVAAANEQRAAAERAIRAEIERQRRFQQQARSVFEQSLAGAGPDVAQQQIQGGESQALDRYRQLESVPLVRPEPAISGETRLVNPVGERVTRGLSEAARARLAGYTEWDILQAIRNLRAAQQLGLLGSMSSGSANVLGTELATAGHAAPFLSAAGPLLSGLGSVGMSFFNPFAKKGQTVSIPLTLPSLPK